ncbi:MAG: ParA family protein [Nitrospiraceae bacterium]|nr:MAG: ParA family protein [Nitrospiraceae bacterium]
MPIHFRREEIMKKVVSVVNLKGGVGKTTTAVNIAACWAEMGKKVLLVDMDPQGSASISLGVMNEGNELLEALQKTAGLPVVATELAGLDLVPSGMALATAGMWHADSRGNDILAQCLEQTPGEWDFIIIDCPPSLGFHTMNSLMTCRYVIIPVETSFLGLNGLKQMVSALESFKALNPEIEIEAVIPCRAHRRRRIHWDIMDTLKEMFPRKVSPIIRENVSLAEAPGRGKPVILTDRISNGADDYRLVSLWLDERINGTEDPELNQVRQLISSI